MNSTEIKHKDGKPIRVYYDNPEGHIEKVWLKGRFYETSRNQLLSYLFNVHKDKIKGKNCIDVGAHIGNHSVFFMHCLGANTVTAFEPNPKSFEYLSKNLSGYWGESTAVNAAIGAKTRKVGLTNLDQSHMVRINPKGRKYQMYSLDDYFADDLEFGLIKIDVEGYEMEVLKGAKRLLEKHKPLIAVETDDKEGVSKYLENFGYKPDTDKHGDILQLNATPTYIFTS